MANNRRAAQKKTEKAPPQEKRGIGWELLGIGLVALGLFSFISLLRDGTGLLGQGLRTVFLGTFGVGAYVSALLVTGGGALVLLSYVFRLKAADWWLGGFIFWILLGIAQLIGGLTPSTGGFDSFVNYVGDAFVMGRTAAGGGAVGGLLLWPLLQLLGRAGCWILLCALLLALALLWTGISLRRVNQRVGETVSRKAQDVRQTREWKRSQASVREFARLDFGEDFAPPARKENFDTNGLDRDFVQEPVQETPIYTPPAEELPVVPEPVPAVSEKPKPSRPRRTAPADIAAAAAEISAEGPPPYAFPPVTLLSKSRNQKREDARSRASKLEQTLQSFGVRAKVVNIACGPAVTQFEIMPAPGVRVSSITNIANDIALSLAAPSIRIEAPIPGKSAVGVEIPNETVSTVKLRDVLDTEAFDSITSPTTFCLGRNIVGENVFTDIAKMPHMLIAGATGSGKSVCINSIIVSILYKATPKEVRLIMIDPKVVELSIYNGIPHLLIPVVTDPKKAAGALHWAVAEMERRYRLFSEKKTRNIQGYNRLVEESGEEGAEKLPSIVVIIDELADLMMVAPGDVEDAICRIAQLARAAGIHLVIATQRPSVDVITGLIKANVPSRIAFAVSSGTDSRTILDTVGAEKLLGRGDMLYSPAGAGKTQRVQGCFVTEEEVEDVVGWILEQQGGQTYSDEIQQEVDAFEVTQKSGRRERGGSAAAEKEEEGTPVYDSLLPDVVDKLYDQGQLSISMVQRKMGVGYARAARIVDQLESLGIVAEGSGAKPRQFRKTRAEIEAILGER